MSKDKMSSYIKYSWFLMIMVFLVILAGGVVRMTQSGMGCPDWPTCFGKWIPPTDASQLPADFEKYLDKQDIDHSFNVYHTWIEYINRLLGALLGVFIFAYLVWTYKKFWKTRKGLVWIAFALLIAVGIEGWMGKVVVEENLSVFKITIHMLGALVIAALPLLIINKLSAVEITVSPLIKHLMTGMIVVVILQIVLGTQVREEIDVISKSLSYEHRELWIDRLGSIFVIHRTFSWLIVLMAMAMYYKGRSIVEYLPLIRNITLVIFAIILLGIIMNYLKIPAIAQPLHLLLACALLMQLIYVRMKLI